MLLVAGKKMAKSSGNFFTLRDLLSKGHDPLAVRYLLMSAHYRAQLNFSEEALVDAAKALEALRGTDHRARRIGATTKKENIALQKVLSAERMEFEKAMDADLNTSRALAAIHRSARAANRAMDEGGLSKRDIFAIRRFFSDLDRVLGILAEETKTRELSEEADHLIKERDRARANKDWQAADRLRNELAAIGIVVEDTPAGTTWKRSRSINS
jgi:cysteinyl-tRNA synthetase